MVGEGNIERVLGGSLTCRRECPLVLIAVASSTVFRHNYQDKYRKQDLKFSYLCLSRCNEDYQPILFCQNGLVSVLLLI